MQEPTHENLQSTKMSIYPASSYTFNRTISIVDALENCVLCRLVILVVGFDGGQEVELLMDETKKLYVYRYTMFYLCHFLTN